MKLKAFTLFLLLFALRLPAQSLSYQLSIDSSDFTYLQNPVIIDSASDWTNQTFRLPLGFTINLAAVASDSIIIDTRGQVKFKGNDHYGVMSFFGTQSKGAGEGQSILSYQNTGASPNRISKVEFKNVGFNSSSSIDTLNYQLWFYETGAIEFHVGPNNYVDVQDSSSAYKPLIGIVNLQQASDLNSFFISGSAHAPLLNAAPAGTELLPLDYFPGDKMIYRLIPQSN